MATELGKAYVQIVPSAKGISGDIEKALNGGGGVDAAGKKAGDGFGSKFLAASGKALKAVGKVTLAATGAAAAGVAGIVKQSLSSFSEYEQLKGGAELMFGDAYDFIAEKAANAYSTVQMSQNDYLQQANSFATGLKTSLDGDAQAAAELADKIINAQADIVAATGNSADNVANAFAGVMKNNFTMLDNLQLGIKPTQEGMEELIETVNKAKGTKYEMGNLADMQSALVDYIDMVGMSGYAQREAAGTIQGSLSMTKAAWDNLLTGLADPDADVGQLFDNLINSAMQLVDNVLPVVEQILTSITDALPQLVNTITTILPGLITQILPPLISAAVSLVAGLASALPGILPVLIQSAVQALVTLIPVLLQLLPQLLNVAMQMVMYLVNVLIQLAPQLIPAAAQMIMQFVQGIVQFLPQLITMGLNLITALIQGLMSAKGVIYTSGAEIITQLVNGLIANLPQIIQAAVELLIELVVALVQNVGILIEAGTTLVQGLVDAFLNTDWGQVGKSILKGLKNSILGGKDEIKAAGESVVQAAESGYEGIVSVATEKSRTIAATGTSALKDEMTQMKSATSNTAAAIEKMETTATDSLRNEMAQMKNDAAEASTAVTDAASTANAAFSNLDLTMPDIDMSGITTSAASITEPLANAVQGETIPAPVIDWSTITNSNTTLDLGSAVNVDATGLNTKFEAAASSASSALLDYDWASTGSSTMSKTANGMSASGAMRSAASRQAQNAASAVNGYDWASVGKNIVDGIAQGITDNSEAIATALEEALDAAGEAVTVTLQISSPSKVMADEIGQWIPKGIALGIETNAGSVTEAMNEVVRPLTYSGTTVRRAAYETGRSYADGRNQTSATSAGSGDEDMINAFRSALAGMRVELDDREVGRFVERTVVRGLNV